MREIKFQRIWKAIITKSYVGYSHPKDIVEWTENARSRMQEFFRIQALHFQRLHNHDWVKCPYQSVSPMFHDSNQKFRWLKRAHGEKTCEFCGSWHPKEFLAFVDQVIENKATKGSINLADNKTKIYIERPGVHNCDDGAIKFKMHHLTAEEWKANSAKINEALKFSSEVFRKKCGL